MVLDYIRSHVPQAKTAPLAGNSIATDRGFIARDMPTLDDYLHYRMIDVSSIKELCRRWYPRIYFGQPEKGLAHRALADIHESIRELQYYRRTAFVAPPGPSTSEIAAIAAELGRPDAARSQSIRPPSARAARIDDAAVPNGSAAMVGVVQLVEHQVVILEVAGSSPVTHPETAGAVRDVFATGRATRLTSDAGVAGLPLLPRDVPVPEPVGAGQHRSHRIDDLDDVAAFGVVVEPRPLLVLTLTQPWLTLL